MTSSVPTPAGAPPSLLVRYGNFLFRYRDAPSPLVLVALFVASPPRWPGDSRRADDLLDVAGVLVDAPATLIVSGLLREEAGEIAAAFARHGLRETERHHSGEWAALLLSRV